MPAFLDSLSYYHHLRRSQCQPQIHKPHIIMETTTTLESSLELSLVRLFDFPSVFSDSSVLRMILHIGILAVMFLTAIWITTSHRKRRRTVEQQQEQLESQPHMSNYSSPPQPIPDPQLKCDHEGTGQEQGPPFPMMAKGMTEEQKALYPTPPPYLPPQDATNTFNPVSTMIVIAKRRSSHAIPHPAFHQ